MVRVASVSMRWSAAIATWRPSRLLSVGSASATGLRELAQPASAAATAMASRAAVRGG
jgi:hypothetical protein